MFLEAKKLLKKQKFVYVADFLNSPYGTKSKKQIKNLVLSNLIQFCEEFSPKCLVLACNTATAVAVDFVRKTFKNIVVIGTEPAILPALRAGFKKILVLCTHATKEHNKLLRNYKNNQKLIFYCPNKLAGLVDENFLNKEKLMPYISKILSKFKGKVDAVVLGCTHYVLVKEQIRKVLDVPMFDGNEAIAKQIAKNVKKSNSKSSKTVFVATDENKQKYLEQVGNFLLKDV